MPQIRVLRHYIHTPFLYMAGAEIVVAAAAAFIGDLIWSGELSGVGLFLPTALFFGLILVGMMAAIGVYESRIREGLMGMTLRTTVAVFLLGTLVMSLILIFIPAFRMSERAMVTGVLIAFVLLVLFRWIVFLFLSEDALNSRIVILGAGEHGLKIATRMRRKADRHAFILLGFIDPDPDSNLVRAHAGRVFSRPASLFAYRQQNEVDEIVVAVDGTEEDSQVPLDELVDCRLSGIGICDV